MYEVIVDVLMQDRSRHVYRTSDICKDEMDVRAFLNSVGADIESGDLEEFPKQDEQDDEDTE